MLKPEEDASFLTFSSGYMCVLLMANALSDAYLVTVLCLLYILYYILSSRLSLPRDLMQYLAIPFLLILIGLAGSADNEPYDVLKDGWYYINPVLTLCAGYLAMSRIKRLQPVLKIFIVCGTLLSTFHLVGLLSNISFLLEASVTELHQENKYGFLISVVSLAIAILTKRQGIELFQSRRDKFITTTILVVNAAAVFFSFSRAYWLSFIILILFGTGIIIRKKMRWLLILVGAIIFFQLFIILSSKEQLNTATMLGKLANSIDEIIIADYYSKATMQQHWRGYESYMAMQAYLQGNVLNLLAGHGFGKLVDLKMFMLMGNERMRYIPIFHNGYMYLLVKTGIAGFVLYLMYLIKFVLTGLNYAKRVDNSLVFVGNMTVALAAVLFVTTFVVAGMFNKAMLFPVLLLLGCLLSYARIRNATLAEEE